MCTLTHHFFSYVLGKSWNHGDFIIDEPKVRVRRKRVLVRKYKSN